MATTSHPLVPIALGSSDTGTEEGRAFHQGRLALFGRWTFIVSGTFLAFFSVLRLLWGLPFDAGVAFHALATAVAGLIWLVGARLRLTLLAMHWVDGAGAVLMSACFGLMAMAYARTMLPLGMPPAPAVFTGLLATSYMLMMRAVAVPSTAPRTAGVGAAAMAPLAAANAAILLGAPPSPQPFAMAYIDALTWQVAAVAMSAVASRVIFGLRAEVSEKRKLGQYTLDEKIGEGGMGVVYRAHHALLRRPTAVKLLPPEKAGDENIQRFEREVQLTASLSHPNTVAIFDYGRTVEGVFYYAMEYLDGINLDQLVRLDGPQPAARVAHIVAQVAGALAEAHGVGLVHRDIKPGNVILCERGGVADVAKVVDFGLVKRFRVDSTDQTMAVTVQTSLLGTPYYMAPEAIRGEVDARSDLYALGAVAYLLLTATPVFRGTSIVEVCAHHLHTAPEPPSSRLGRAVAPELERLVMRCLAKAPTERPKSARALVAELAATRFVGSWSADDADAWWRSYRERGSPRPAAAATAATHA